MRSLKLKVHNLFSKIRTFALHFRFALWLSFSWNRSRLRFCHSCIILVRYLAILYLAIRYPLSRSLTYTESSRPTTGVRSTSIGTEPNL
jgi:hypothetical protein